MNVTKIEYIKEQILEALETVKDPEIPFVSVVDLGIIRDISIEENEQIRIVMTPTFVGCPALKIIQTQIGQAVKKAGYEQVQVDINYDTPWTSNMITDKGKIALKDFGLAPPRRHCGEIKEEDLHDVECPWCNSKNTNLRSPFGGTLCRAIHYCNECKQSFEQFKPL